MKLALIGYGKMGKLVEKAAEKRAHTVVGRIDSASASSWGNIAEADVCIDFSHSKSLVENLKKVAQYNKALVIGTTGWEEKKEEVAQLVSDYQLGVLYSPNFSLGMNLFIQLTRYFSKLINPFEEYDIAGFEAHHNQKEDCPSGSALALSSVVEENIKRLGTLSWASMRCGAIPGTHSIFFDSPHDTISLTHTARSRESFALGAISAAEWLYGKKGFYTFENFLDAVITGK